MQLKYLIFYIWISSIKATTYYTLNDDSVLEISCSYNDTCSEEDIIIQAEYGYKILIVVKTIDIDGTSGDFLLIKSGTTIEDGLTGRIFTYYIKQEREYLSLTSNILIHFEIKGDKEYNHTAYVLTAEHFGEQVTTPMPTTTGIPWPIPSDDDYPYLTVNISISHFNNQTIPNFQDAVVKLASDYIVYSGLELSQPISIDNIQISNVIQCPMYWPNTDNCIQITFALPVLLMEDSEYYGTYQLNETHLYAMWKNASEYFNDPDYTLYELPNASGVIIMWMTVICSTVLLFGILYLVSGYECSGYVLKKRKKELEQQNRRLSEENRRTTVTSLPPHPLQTVPPLFDSDMAFYDPDSSPPFLRQSGRSDPHDDTQELDSFRHFTYDGRNLEETTDT